jgi:hypothetical protein
LLPAGLDRPDPTCPETKETDMTTIDRKSKRPGLTHSEGAGRG